MKKEVFLSRSGFPSLDGGPGAVLFNVEALDALSVRLDVMPPCATKAGLAVRLRACRALLDGDAVPVIEALAAEYMAKGLARMTAYRKAYDEINALFPPVDNDSQPTGTKEENHENCESN